MLLIKVPAIVTTQQSRLSSLILGGLSGPIAGGLYHGDFVGNPLHGRLY